MDRITFHGLYQRHAEDVRRFALYLTGDQDLASEIAAETFFRAWVGRAAIRTSTAKAYLIAIARNLARDEARRRRRLASPNTVPERSVPESAAVHVELRETLEALERLPPDYREPLALAASGLGYQEVAGVLSLSLATVKIRIHRGRLQLARLLEQRQPTTGRTEDEP